ncbi:MAG TPA: hypothetical protein VKB34_04345 [Povalibacter sp.]|nr:hypothetical protein [Povalibacter sp.]
MSVDVHWFLPILSGASFRESWPYGPAASAFHPDLAIDVDPDVRSSKPVVAPLSGNFIVLADATFKTCGVFLMPSAEVTRALVHDGIGELALFIRTLDLADLVQRFRPRITAKLPPKVTAEQQVKNFTEGKLAVDIASGDDIALLAPISTANAHGLAQFEILFAPNRSSLVSPLRALAYAKRLVDPQYQYRRLDPLAFYFKVRRGAGFQTQIATAHASHPFWTAPLTRRGLLEIREERDRPRPITVQLQTNGAPPVAVTVSQDNWGHYEAIQNNGATGPVDLSLQKPSWRFTPLPSSDKSFTAPANREQVPFHWALQSIYMDTAADTASWFVPNTPPLSFFTEKNTVVPLVDGTAAFTEMVSWLRRIRGGEQFAWLAGWFCKTRFAMLPDDPTTELRQLAQSIVQNNGEFRLLAWHQKPLGKVRVNDRAVDDINALGPRAFAILDSQTRLVGSHHQKFMVTYVRPDEAAAFCGGIDVNANRLDSPEHNRPSAYHDVHARLTGPSVQDFMRLYIERWNDHEDVIASPGKKINSVLGVNPTAGDCFVQVTRTMPRGTHRSVMNGVEDSYNAVRNAIRRAERYIYLEEQYLVPYWGHVPFESRKPGEDPGIVQELLDALARIRFLIIVIPNHMLSLQMLYRRHEFLEALTQAAGPNAAKVRVYYPKRKKPSKVKTDMDEEELVEKDMNSQGLVVPANADQEYLDALGGVGASGSWPWTDEIYVHTKLWLIDDVYVKCGSMNFNRRGFTYDSEADFHAVDGALTRGRRSAALAFRKALFAEHTRSSPNDVPDDVDDVLDWWIERAANSGRLGAYDWKRSAGPGPGLDRDTLDLDWRNIIDPDGR